MLTDLLGRFLVPSGILILLLFVSLLLLLHPRTRRLVSYPAVTALVVYAVFGSGFVAHLLLGPLERAYPPVTDAGSLGNVEVIVVLTGYASEADQVSPPSWLNESSAYRVLEVLWLAEQLPDSRILVSGNDTSGQTMRRAFISLGVDADRINVDKDAVDTGVSASLTAETLPADTRCVLVTSAGHMPRAMLTFRRAGVDCTAVPTEYQTPFEPELLTQLPSPAKLRLSDLAMREYLGIVWYWLLGRI